MGLEAVKIPANIQVEEKILGPIGLRQLFLLLAGGGSGYVIFSILAANGWVGAPALIVSGIPVLFTGAFAFIKINDVTLFRLVLLTAERTQKPSKRTFGPRPGISINIRTHVTAAQVKARAAEKKKKKEEPKAEDNFAELSTLLDTGLGKLVKPPSGAIKDESSDIAFDDKLPDATSASAPVDQDSIEADPLKQKSPTIDGVTPSSATASTSVTAKKPKVIRDINPPAA